MPHFGGRGAVEFYSLLVGSSLNIGNLWTEVLFAVCAVLLLGNWSLNVRCVLRNLLEMLLVYALEKVLVVTWAHLLPSLSDVTFIPMFLSLAIYAATYSELSATDRIARCSTFAASFVLIVSLTGVLLPSLSLLKRVSWGQVVPSLVSYVSMVALALVIRRFSVRKFVFVPRGFVVLIVIMDVLGALAGVSFITYTSDYVTARTDSYANIILNRYEQAVSQVNLIVDVSFLLLIVLAYLMFYMLAREHDERTEMLVTRKSMVDNVDVANVTKSMYDSLREVRHEIKNHDAYMLSLIDAGEFDKLRDFLESYTLGHAEVLRQVACGNVVVDAVVNAKLALARSHGVEIETMLAVPPELPYDGDDVFCLLSNLLDNAIEGTVAKGDGAGPIQLKITPEAGYYFFTVSNPCNPSTVQHGERGGLVTSKKNDDIHGFGTRVIAHIAEKYHGQASFAVKGETFVASAMLARGAAGTAALEEG